MADFRSVPKAAKALSKYVEAGLIFVAAEVLAEDQGAQSAETWAARKAYAAQVARGLSDSRLYTAAFTIAVLENRYDNDQQLKRACRDQWNVLSGAATGSAT